MKINDSLSVTSFNYLISFSTINKAVTCNESNENITKDNENTK